MTGSVPVVCDGPRHMRARVTHARQGDSAHRFTYAVDYLLVDPETEIAPGVLARGLGGMVRLLTRDHGGARGQGAGARWLRDVLARAGAPEPDQLYLLAQPRVAGVWFTPVSFWLALRGGDLVAFVAEVNNTFGQRHSYLCHNPGFAPIDAQDTLSAAKVFHVSPFQDVAGTYRFRVQVTGDKITLRIHHQRGAQGVLASMVGSLRPMGPAALAGMALRRPLGPIRVLSLIHWHAFRLWCKGARYRPVPVPPEEEVSL